MPPSAESNPAHQPEAMLSPTPADTEHLWQWLVYSWCPLSQGIPLLYHYLTFHKPCLASRWKGVPSITARIGLRYISVLLFSSELFTHWFLFQIFLNKGQTGKIPAVAPQNTDHLHGRRHVGMFQNVLWLLKWPPWGLQLRGQTSSTNCKAASPLPPTLDLTSSERNVFLPLP